MSLLLSLLGYGLPQERIVERKTRKYKVETDLSSDSLLAIRPKKQIQGKYYYALRIVTGSQAEAGRDALLPNIFISLIGDNDEEKVIEAKVSRYQWLLFNRNFRRSTYTDLIIESNKDLGKNIQVVKVRASQTWLLKIFKWLKNSKFLRSIPIIMLLFGEVTPNWFIDFFAVANLSQDPMADRQVTYFPCYHWIGETTKVEATSKTATVKQVADNPVLQKQRKDFIEVRQNLYKWKTQEHGIPSAMDTDSGALPYDEQFQRAKLVKFLRSNERKLEWVFQFWDWIRGLSFTVHHKRDTGQHLDTGLSHESCTGIQSTNDDKSQQAPEKNTHASKTQEKGRKYDEHGQQIPFVHVPHQSYLQQSQDVQGFQFVGSAQPAKDSEIRSRHGNLVSGNFGVQTETFSYELHEEITSEHAADENPTAQQAPNQSIVEEDTHAHHTDEKVRQADIAEVTTKKNFDDFERIFKEEKLYGPRSKNVSSAPQRKKDEWESKDVNIPVYAGYRWITDVEFGFQILNGVNPVIIKKCTKIPVNFAVTAEMVKNLLSNGQTLEDEMKNGHVYICDLSEILHEIPCRSGYHCAAPICLLYVNASKQLVPIAIQLKRDPGPDNPVFLPTDGQFAWLLAKMFYRAADAQYHQLSSHYISCHATMEAYGVATMRNIPDAHPLYKLLQPHFRYTMSINKAARERLINKNGILAQNFAIGSEGMIELFKRVSRHHSVHWTNIKRNIKKRGVDDPDKLPGYYYRDDGLRIWDAIEAYVREIIKLFYDNDNDVKADTEIEQWAEEIYSIAFPGLEGNTQGHGFPKKMEKIEDLIEYCTLIIFTGSAQHAAVNFGQFDIYGYTPNAPIGMRKPPPKRKKGYYNLMEYLPDTATAQKAAGVTFALAQFSPDEIFLGEYPYCWYTEDEARNAVKKFVERLKKLDEEIVTRNHDTEKVDIPYYHLRPGRVPNSITI